MVTLVSAKKTLLSLNPQYIVTNSTDNKKKKRKKKGKITSIFWLLSRRSGRECSRKKHVRKQNFLKNLVSLINQKRKIYKLNFLYIH